MSDTECLNLNITVPNVQSHGKGLPVLVWVHGGALLVGSGTWPQYDFAALVRHSVGLGTPFIGVTINYRTGIFGFLTSEELRTAGFKANNGLRDQKVAFQWIKKNIAGFGGDPNQVTAIGQSAGGISLTLQLQSSEPLFQRLAAIAGTCLLGRPVPLFVHEMVYKVFCEAQGLTALSGQDRIKAIEKIPSEELIFKVPPSVPALPALDADFLCASPTFQSAEAWSKGGDPAIPGLKWCKELLVGDMKDDGTIFDGALAHRVQGIASAFEESLKRSIPQQGKAIDSLLSAYHISSSTSDRAAYLSILELGNDIAFYIPEETFARRFPGTTYVYHLNEPNPWDGPFKGFASHLFDVALLFRNYDAQLPLHAIEVGHAFGDGLIKFANSQAPWQASSQSKPVAWVFGGEAGTSELREDFPEKVDRRNAIFEFKDTPGWDALHMAWTEFIARR
ncbi:uncharacterized protein A1O5_07350 [Cladophialophora psammophila CBS 110553]|uniref:Carboxylesterase type B domain-containing protein n=1 Tax=Cladophialophora psammophila CBS 110553 TaxID=1182543 RepID=W9XFZ9_9EURO|nr:uncharacterized protein A1O5_07350 [Cladophialophora psammophila CBS 110553]EXJ69314.1 hypothetical protein A1O5_07350 [Cladophialophora psammophila CBS 110553]